MNGICHLISMAWRIVLDVGSRVKRNSFIWGKYPKLISIAKIHLLKRDSGEPFAFAYGEFKKKIWPAAGAAKIVVFLGLPGVRAWRPWRMACVRPCVA